MIGIDAVILSMLVLKFLPLFYVRASIYLFALSERYLVFSIVPIVLLVLYLVFSVVRRWRHSVYARVLIIGFLGVFLVGSYLGLQLAAREASQPYLYIHDGAVQTEDAIAALKSGQNPYTTDYSTTTFGAFPDTFSEATRPNPAWSHYVYLPFPLLVGVPWSWVAEQMFGWFDVRMLYVAFFALLVLSAAMLTRDREHRILVLILVLFNPYFVQFFIAGYNDVLFLGLVGATAALLQRRKPLFAAILFGAAIASKQPAWFLLPFFAAFVYGVVPHDARRRAVLKYCGIALGIAVLTMLPFLVWSPTHFIESTIGYAIGTTAMSYPVSGFGFGQLLVSTGAIASMWDSYPFWIWQALLGIPLLVVLVRWQLRSNSVARMLTCYAALTTMLLFFSRYFNDSHLGMILVLLLLAFAAGRFGIRQGSEPDA